MLPLVLFQWTLRTNVCNFSRKTKKEIFHIAAKLHLGQIRRGRESGAGGHKSIAPTNYFTNDKAGPVTTSVGFEREGAKILRCRRFCSQAS